MWQLIMVRGGDWLEGGEGGGKGVNKGVKRRRG